MPTWGLTEKQIGARPWGLDPRMLRPYKKITDPIHGDIPITQLEAAILDSRPMQRLRRVRQLGSVQLVYPGASHSRFAHALGALRVAQDLMDVVASQHLGPVPVSDLFTEWKSNSAAEYDRMVAEATVLARLGGLLHDVGHIPFGHTVEDELHILRPHDDNEPRYRVLWELLTQDLATSEPGMELPEDLADQLRLLILSKGERTPDKKYPFVADIVGNTICADLIDYLWRDHYFTGLPFAVGRRFLDGFYVTRSDHPYHAQRMVVQISRSGQVRADVVSELFKYLRYRYELSERVLAHHAKLAVDVMLGKVMSLWRDALRSEFGGTDLDRATATIEEQMLHRSDDGILEYLIDQSDTHKENRLWQGVGAISRQIQRRSLFKQIGFYTRSEMSVELYRRYQAPEERAALEERAANYAGAADPWMVGVWIPDPAMRSKPADVLVDYGDGKGVVTLAQWDQENSKRGGEILESHRGLWTIRAYAHPDLSGVQRRVVLSVLADGMGIGNWDGQPQTNVAEIAADVVGRELQGAGSQRARLESVAQGLSEGTFTELVAALREDVEIAAEDASLAAWRARFGRLEHSDLERTLDAASQGAATTTGQDATASDDARISWLNVRLFLDELDDEVIQQIKQVGEPAEVLADEAERLHELALRHLASSAAAQRDGVRAQSLPDNRRTAFELAVQEFLAPTPLL